MSSLPPPSGAQPDPPAVAPSPNPMADPVVGARAPACPSRLCRADCSSLGLSGPYGLRSDMRRVLDVWREILCVAIGRVLIGEAWRMQRVRH